MKCPNCGREILDDSSFCEFCGKPVVRSKVNKKKSYGKYWLIALLIFTAMVIFYSIIFTLIAY